MREIVHLTLDSAAVDWRTIQNKIGMPGNRKNAEWIDVIFRRSQKRFLETCDPKGILKEVAVDEFDPIYRGEGKNEDPSPLAVIYPKAGYLALYIVTLGHGVDRALDQFLGAGEVTAAYMFDIIASEGAEAAADTLQAHYQKKLQNRPAIDQGAKTLRYSPGYCGWHISAQRKIFKSLQPEEIGITLNSHLSMQPLKSNSGVMVTGPGELHRFQNNFLFCRACKTRNCRDRIKQIEE
jgi:hypothetical protein